MHSKAYHKAAVTAMAAKKPQEEVLRLARAAGKLAVSQM